MFKGNKQGILRESREYIEDNTGALNHCSRSFALLNNFLSLGSAYFESFAKARTI
jgi:hypothetical protein